MPVGNRHPQGLPAPQLEDEGDLEEELDLDEGAAAGGAVADDGVSQADSYSREVRWPGSCVISGAACLVG
jgi:hypothetical protein